MLKKATSHSESASLDFQTLSTGDLAREIIKQERLHDNCGVVGASGIAGAAHTVYRGLHQLQHRGQESAGIASVCGELLCHKDRGLVTDAFPAGFDFHRTLPGETAIGHVRYSTAGGDRLQNVQPFVVENIAVAHNGNLTNSLRLRAQLVAAGSRFQSSTDTEVINHLIAQIPADRPDWVRIAQALEPVRGSYALVITIGDTLYAVRDPSGNRPLVLGSTKTGSVVASETCALALMDATFKREVQPGEILEIRGADVQSHRVISDPQKTAQCLFELIYFARPDSHVFGHNIYSARELMGRALASQHPVRADVVVPVLDSGMIPALGFSAESQIPLRSALVRNHYVHRTFIEPTQKLRDYGTRMKHNVNAELVAGKSVVLIDDSIVRGTTMIKLVTLLREQGVREVHVRISSPPVIGSCHYGIDTPSQEELMASRYDVPAMKDILGADSLGFLSLRNIRASLKLKASNFCDACFTQKYPLGKIEPEALLSLTSQSLASPSLASLIPT